MTADTPLLVIEALAHDGRGIARTPDGVVFVSDCLPGQTVRARLLRRKANFAEACRVELVQAGPDDRAPLCPHQAQCGGCPWQCLARPAQLRWKEQLLRDALQRIGRLTAPPLLPILADPQETHFRNKMEFAFGMAPDSGTAGRHDGARLCLGLRQRGGLAVVPVPGCRLLPPETLTVVRSAEELARELSAGDPRLTAHTPAPRPHRGGQGRAGRDRGKGFWRFLTLRRGLAPQCGLTPQEALDRPEDWRIWAVCLTSPGDARQRRVVRTLGERLLARHPHLAGFLHEERQRDDALAQGERRVFRLGADGGEGEEAGLFRLPLGGQWFTLDAASFFQVNTDAAQLLAREVLDQLLPALCGRAADARDLPASGRLLDLYCGVGAPGLLAARHVSETCGLEYDARAVRLARRNAAALGCRGVWQAGDAGKLLSERADAPGSFDAALVDPPRAGMDAVVREHLLRLRPPHILLVSCNPATLARDAACMAQDYEPLAIRPVDLFPHTPHLESVSLWRRR